MDKLLQLKIYVDGDINDTPFPNKDNPIEIGAFRYDAKRMGGAPTITASVNYPYCLEDNKWTDNVYAKFNGEKYYLKQVPTSSYDNEDTMYRYDLELVSERVILDNVYFFDAVTGTPQGDDKPVSNSTKVVFFGNIREFVKRLNSSLEYAKLLKWEDGVDDNGNAIKIPKGYYVVVDNNENITTEEKLMSFEDQFFSNVLQEIYNTYEVPYYFEGKTIHIGYTNNAIPDVFAYGVDNALLSITKNNANFKTVNRVTGIGSSDNIPFYYPNNSPKGEIELSGPSASRYTIVDGEAFAYEAEIDDTIRFISGVGSVASMFISFDGVKYEPYTGTALNIERKDTATWQLWVSCLFSVSLEGRFTVDGHLSIDGSTYTDYLNFVQLLNQNGENIEGFSYDGVTTPIIKAGNYTLVLGFSIPYIGRLTYTIEPSVSVESDSFWYNVTQEKKTSLSKLGLVCSGSPKGGDTITQKLAKYIKTSQNLMPYKYRKTDGVERFYNAENGLYKDENGRDVVFNNPYEEGKPREHIIHVDDLKPTIKGVKVGGLNIDMFSEFAYDKDDNDETYEDEEGNVYFKHPYFYGKLRRMDFNLFDHAIEQQPMTISFTSGDCGACNFEIGVTEDYPQKNPVQVDSSGNLVRDENGMVLAGVEGTQQQVTTFQERQQDTSQYEVWIALKKEEETYGILMPQSAHLPKAAGSGNDGDTFVILGINLPKSYIVNAEKRLEAEIIKYMKENNDEKFTFSINFSRIFFEENPRFLKLLNENARINIAYGKDENNLDEEGNPKDKIYTLYVSSFSYTMSEGDVLPEIRVELDDALTISQNPIQNAISEVRSEFGRALSNVDIVALANPYFIRKDTDDVARGTVDFRKGIKFGEGGKVEILDNNSAKLTIEYLEVTKKASFTSLEIQEKTHVGGQLLVTPAAINCGEVEEFDGFYRCYFQTKGANNTEIFNQFSEGDQAICQTFNAWGSKYYWRLVVGIGKDYIDLSKTDCDEYSDIPSEGDRIIQLGNREDKRRQNAIVIAAYGNGSPYFIQYKGIDSYEITKDNVVTKFSPDENIITGKMKILAGSSGDLNAGGQNLLRNSGFTGDYLSEALADKEVMEEAKKTFSDPLDHWKDDNYEDGVNDGSVGVEVLPLQGISSSGYGVVLKDTTSEAGVSSSAILKQSLYYELNAGESYTISFKAKGMIVEIKVDEETREETIIYNSLVCTVGDVSRKIPLNDKWERYVSVFNPSANSKTFSIAGNDVTLCDIQLERGTVATAWNNSYLDNASDRTYWQSMEYLQAALADYTEIIGGLVLTNQIKLGEHVSGGELDKDTFVENAGVSGEYIDNNSPAFWAGGNFDKAIATIEKFKNNPSYKPTDDEWGNMANFVVTHGGRAILNDMIMRGIVYASGGEFQGKIIATEGEFKGSIKADDGYFSGRMQMPFMSLTNRGLYFVAELISSSQIEYAYRLTTDSPSHIRIMRDLSTQKISLELPKSYDFDGWVLNIYSDEKSYENDPVIEIKGSIKMPNSITEYGTMNVVDSIVIEYGGYSQFVCVGKQWVYLNQVELAKKKTISANLDDYSSTSNRYDLTGVSSIIATNERNTPFFQLPSSPLDGEEINIYVIKNLGISVYGNQKQIIDMSKNNGTNVDYISTMFSTTEDAQGVYKFIFAASIDKWIATWK